MYEIRSKLRARTAPRIIIIYYTLKRGVCMCVELHSCVSMCVCLARASQAPHSDRIIIASTQCGLECRTRDRGRERETEDDESSVGRDVSDWCGCRYTAVFSYSRTGLIHIRTQTHDYSSIILSILTKTGAVSVCNNIFICAAYYTHPGPHTHVQCNVYSCAHTRKRVEGIASDHLVLQARQIHTCHRRRTSGRS